MINISSENLAIVRHILKKHLPAVEVRAFGSRISDSNQPYSDLDLLIVTDQPIPLKTMAELKFDFEESDLPFRVDLVNWQRISNEFRKEIEKRNEVILNKRE